MFDIVVDTLVLALIVNDKEEASTLRLRISVTAPGVGKSHSAFPSDCFGRSAVKARSMFVTPRTQRAVKVSAQNRRRRWCV